MNTHHKRSPEAWFGAGVGFVAFLFTGAIPSLVYGGYMGLIMAGILFGHPVEPTLMMRFMTGGGMLLGLVATLSLFLVVGAALGSGVGVLMRALTGQPHKAAAPAPAVTRDPR